jgi:phosphotransferase system enzyme I (PtsP)
MTRPLDSDLAVQVHEHGDSALDGILRLIELATDAQPLEQTLCAMAEQIAALAAVPVASIYVRESGAGGDRLVLRGNVGFPHCAIGRVSLALGEGLVGLVAERSRPVTVAVAGRDVHYKYVPGLGEDRFPAFLGVPLFAIGRVAGVLVLQRAAPTAFNDAEVVTAASMAAPVCFAIERGLRDAAAPATDRRHSATLVGIPRAPGSGMGRATFVPTTCALRGACAPSDADALERAFARVERDLFRTRRELARRGGSPGLLRALDDLALLLSDARLRARAAALCAEHGLALGLAGLARHYARAPFQLTPPHSDPPELMLERAREVEDLCLVLYSAATDASLLPKGGVWIAARGGMLLAVCALARRAAALLLEGELSAETPVAELLSRGGIPLVAEVTGLFAWTRPHDLLLVCGQTGNVRVNPSSERIARVRRLRARAGSGPE